MTTHTPATGQDQDQDRQKPPELEEGFCQTVGCLAGHVALDQGFRFAGEFQFPSHQGGPILVHPDGRRLRSDHEDGPDTVAKFAQDHLSLDDEEAGELFGSNNTLENLSDTVDRLCDQPWRSAESKARLQRALGITEIAAWRGYWDQANWIIITDEELSRNA